MKFTPYKIKSEIYFDTNFEGTALEAKMLFVCDQKACENCSSDLCYLTSDIKHAKRFDVDE